MNRGANRDSEGLKGGERVQDKDGLGRAVEGQQDRNVKTRPEVRMESWAGRTNAQARRWKEAVERRI
jgi:hypothetical protein